MVERLIYADEHEQTCMLRGSKSRNKVSVGEPAEGSLPSDMCGLVVMTRLPYVYACFV